ncbi:hypothetical protein P078_0033 [Lactococcus phage P078]|uniref:Uncharacterized protein n=1 Tax=Lactococcus phage P078 TaxID=1476886 RepID=X4Y7K4_9CAUD|nr:hypothetical protein GJ21_gp33 [Lactococcus phage P078]AHV82996.1 hypothetical protein P078_0033 [Lactococcus phage P078]
MKTCKKERNKNKQIAEHNRKAVDIISKKSRLNSKNNTSITVVLPVCSDIYFKYNFLNKKEIIFRHDICHKFQLDMDGDILTLNIPSHMDVTDYINKVLKG